MTKDRVLYILRKSGGYVSGEDISHSLGISRMAVSKSIAALRSEGYEIDSKTNCGHKLTGEPESFSRTGVASYLENGDDILFFDELLSTNTYLKSLEDAADGLCAVALRQTAGRGRRGHSFFSPGGLYMSVLIRPRCGFSELSCLTAFTGVAVCEALNEVCGVSPSVKWVNDVLLDGKKVAGILTELVTEADSDFVSAAIIGVGINTDSTVFPPELEDIAGSVADIAQIKVDKNRLCAVLYEKLLALRTDLTENRKMLLQKYRRLCSTVGSPVTVHTDPPYEAEAIAIDDDCSLIVRLKGGQQRRISFGEVSVRPKQPK